MKNKKSFYFIFSLIFICSVKNVLGTIYVSNEKTISSGEEVSNKWKPTEGTGIAVKEGGSLTLDNNFNYTLDSEESKKLIDIEKGASALNKGIISVNGSKAMLVDVRTGNFINEGTMKISGEALGINLKQSNSFATNKGIIEVLGDKSKGVNVENTSAKFTNEGTIVVNGKEAIGISVNKGEAINAEVGIINVSGEKATGIKITNGTGTNKGTIVVDKSSTQGNKWATGIFATGKESIGINEGIIKVNGYSGSASHGMQSEEGGVIKNNESGKIYLSGRFASGMTAAKGGISINEGSIYAEKGAQGMRVEGTASRGTNKGTITSTTTDKDSGAIYMDGGVFINEGSILAENGNAIYSDDKKNNNSSVVMKSGSSIKGKILGNDKINLLYMDGKNTYDNLLVENYEAIVVRGGDSSVTNSNIELEFNTGTSDYLNSMNNTLEKDKTISSEKGILTVSNSVLTIDMKNSIGEKPIIDAEKLVLNGDMSFSFSNSVNDDKYSLKEALGVDNIEFGSDFKPNSTIVWSYDTSIGDLTATKKSYKDILTTSKLNGFLSVVEEERGSKYSNTSIFNVIKQMEQMKPGEESLFTNGMTQLSGAVYGYLPDIMAINSRGLTSMMNNRVDQKNFTRNESANTTTQDVLYSENRHKIGGLMNVKYNEKSVIGITEKQIDLKSTLGLLYGGGNGNVDFQNGINGNAKIDIAYVGGYYNTELTDNISLTNNLRFAYQHNSVNRKISVGGIEETFNSTTPTYGFGLGTRIRYSYEKENYRFGVYTGIDWTKILQGSINELSQTNSDLTVSNIPVNDNEYDSLVPSLGINFENRGYIFDKKYGFGINIGYETEIGNIKDGKKIKIKELKSPYVVRTSNREDTISYSIFGKLNLTENLIVSTTYALSRSKEYDADKLTVGAEYKFERFAGGIFNPIYENFENRFSQNKNRWRGTFSFALEAEDDSDRLYNKAGNMISGDYKTSTSYIPKFMLSLNDTQTKWSYYFEAFYRDNEMLQGLKGGEAEQHARRIHLEARWSDNYSRGKYGVNLGYRNETSEKPKNYGLPTFEEIKVGIHQLRIMPNFTYRIKNGFSLLANSTNILEYYYQGPREAQMDYRLENQVGLLYEGLMPKLSSRLIFYRDDRWYDHKNNIRKYQSTQIRPSLTYYFGNGSSLLLEGRIPINHGGFSKAKGTKEVKSENFESRYGMTYFQPLAPGLTGLIGMNFLIFRDLNKTTGKNTRSHSFRPKVGFNYSF